MNICVLKEIKVDENRVALQPVQVKKLVNDGHIVYIETNAGINSGFIDSKYEENGGIITTKKIALKNSKLVLKVKAPLESEYNDYQRKHILFTYLHFDENIKKENILKLIKSGFTGIAYEWVGSNGNYPLLMPMSKLTGYLFAQRAIELLSHYKGKMAGRYESEHFASNILIIGLGTIGMSAFKYSLVNGLNITILDKNPNAINDKLNFRFKTNNIKYTDNIDIIKFDTDNPNYAKQELNLRMEKFDIILNCAVRRDDLPKNNLEYLIDIDMIKKLEKGSIVCDTTGCDKDLIETCISSSELNYVDIIEDIIHYNCDHIPSLVANTSTRLLTNQTFEFICEIAKKGFDKAIKDNKKLKNGVSCKNGYITHLYSSNKKDMSKNYKVIDDFLKKKK